MSNGMMSPTAYDELVALTQQLGMYTDNPSWSNTGYGIMDNPYYNLATNGGGGVDQQMVSNKLGLEMLMGDGFATGVTDPAERERMRQELAATYLEQLKGYQQAYTGPIGGVTDPNGGVTNPNVDEPPPSTVIPEAGPMTMRGASTPFMDSYMRAREAAQRQGPVSSMFAQELNKE